MVNKLKSGTDAKGLSQEAFLAFGNQRICFLFVQIYAIQLLHNMKHLLIFFALIYRAQAHDRTVSLSSSISSTNHADITLIGAYGDLAKKYLWKGFFDLYQQSTDFAGNEWTIDFYGASHKSAKEGEKLLNGTLDSAVMCSADELLCNERRSSFIKNIRYTQLKDKKDYLDHCAALSTSSKQSQCYADRPCLYQRIFYLSVPPFAYKSISEYLASHCRPMHGTGSMKVVFEKPFGHNQASAVDQAKFISQHLKDEEVYRVDHYLGKKSIKEIIPFRQQNFAIDQMLNRKNIERIEIVMKEAVSAKGRTRFYNKYGVLNDVMQNHLSEILYLMAMDLPFSLDNSPQSQALNENKVKLLQQIDIVTKNNVVLGQYQGYQEEVEHEAAELNTTATTIPTFAAVKLSISSPRWREVPIVMVAGKKLDERIGYARVVFKERHFSVNTNKKGCHREDVIFHIGHGPLRTAAILVSRSLPLTRSYAPDGWKITRSLDDVSYLNLNVSCFNVFVPIEEQGAYEFLIERLFLGEQEHFLSLPGLLQSWKVWGEIVDDQSLPLAIYTGGNSTEDQLNFHYDDDTIFFQSRKTPAISRAISWTGRSIVEGFEPDVTSALAEDFKSAALNAVSERKVFHAAFSGGNSPLPLLKYLSTSMRSVIPWASVHIWQVDERCTSDQSQINLNTLKTELLHNIPYLQRDNIHPMPSSMCDDENASSYEMAMKSVIAEVPRLDYVVLGLGKDGHTASLFPAHELLDEKERLVAVADDVPHQVAKRMTLTFEAINSARNIALIVSGHYKCETMRAIKRTGCDDLRRYPVCGLAPRNGRLTWFVSACEESYVF